MQKQRIKQLLSALPDDVDIDLLIEQLRLLDRLEFGEEEIAAGRLIDHADVGKRFASLLK